MSSDIECKCGAVIKNALYMGWCEACGRTFTRISSDGGAVFTGPYEWRYAIDDPAEDAQSEPLGTEQEVVVYAKPGCYKDAEATEPCTNPGDPVGAVVYPPQDNASQLGAEQAEVDDDAQRERERIRLVDGYPGEWEWTGEMWRLTIYCDMTTIDVTVEDLDGYWSASLLVGEALDPRRVEIVEATGMRKTLMEAAAAIRPHAEAMVKVLEGMSDG